MASIYFESKKKIKITKMSKNGSTKEKKKERRRNSEERMESEE